MYKYEIARGKTGRTIVKKCEICGIKTSLYCFEKIVHPDYHMTILMCHSCLCSINRYIEITEMEMEEEDD